MTDRRIIAIQSDDGSQEWVDYKDLPQAVKAALPKWVSMISKRYFEQLAGERQ